MNECKVPKKEKSKKKVQFYQQTTIYFLYGIRTHI